MSESFSPEPSTAALTACSACAPSGVSADRVARENPTPLTATLHRLSHMRHRSFTRTAPSAREPELRQRKVVVQRLEDNLHATPHLCLGIRSLQQIAGEQRPGCVVELHYDARVRDGS